jgi:hypothetical protein
VALFRFDRARFDAWPDPLVTRPIPGGLSPTGGVTPANSTERPHDRAALDDVHDVHDGNAGNDVWDPGALGARDLEVDMMCLLADAQACEVIAAPPTVGGTGTAGMHIGYVYVEDDGGSHCFTVDVMDLDDPLHGHLRLAGLWQQGPVPTPTLQASRGLQAPAIEAPGAAEGAGLLERPRLVGREAMAAVLQTAVDEANALLLCLDRFARLRTAGHLVRLADTLGTDMTTPPPHRWISAPAMRARAGKLANGLIPLQ